MTSQCRYITHCPLLTKSEDHNRMKLRDNRTIYVKRRNGLRGRLACDEAMAQASETIGRVTLPRRQFRPVSRSKSKNDDSDFVIPSDPP